MIAETPEDALAKPLLPGVGTASTCLLDDGGGNNEEEDPLAHHRHATGDQTSIQSTQDISPIPTTQSSSEVQSSDQPYPMVTIKDFVNLYFCLDSWGPSGGSSQRSTREEDRDDGNNNNDGPIIIVLDTVEDRGSNERAVQHPPVVMHVAGFLYHWIHKWQYIFCVTATMIALAKICLPYAQVGFETMMFIFLIHFVFLWAAGIALPLGHFSGAQLKDLMATAWVALFVDDYFHELFFSSRLCWLGLTLQLRLRLFPDDQRRQRSFALLFAIPMFFIEFFQMLMLALIFLLLLAFFGNLLLRYDTYIPFILSKVLPCTPFQSIKRMELDAYEVDDDDEDATQGKVDQQILALGRPLHTTTSFLDRGQKTFASAVSLLGLWTLVWIVSRYALVDSITMSTIAKTHHAYNFSFQG